MTARVTYREDQVLHAEDLIDEQVYRIAMRRRHNIAHHGWGIVTGLELSIEDSAKENSGQVLKVEPGLAVDGYGRELILTSRYTVEVDSPGTPSSDHQGDEQLPGDQSLWARLGKPEAIDFWLLYAHHAESPTNGEHRCGTEEFRRIEERAVVRCTPVISGTITDPLRPPTVDDDDFRFPPFRVPPDDSEQQWPVFLGRISLKVFRKDVEASGDSNSVRRWNNDLSPRPTATLFGGVVDAISQRVRMQLTDEARDQARFSIQIEEASTTNGDVSPESEQSPRMTDQLVITREGDISIVSPCRIEGLLDLDGSDTVPDNAPRLQKPANGASMAVQPPTFTWLSLPSADIYELLIKKIDSNGQFQVVMHVPSIGAKSVDVQSFELSDALHDPLPGNYRWWVRSKSKGAEDGIYSIPFDFTITPNGADQTATAENTEFEIAHRKSAEAPRNAYLVFDRGAEPSPVARPWHVYRAHVVPEEQPEFEELRLELPTGTDTVDPDRQAFVLGHFEARDDAQDSQPATPNVEFVPSLAVLASDTVIVDSLDVRGQMVTGPIEPDTTDKRFRRALVDNWARGHLAGSSALRANSLDVAVELSKESGIKSSITIFNPGAEPVTITDLIATYTLNGKEQQPDDDYFSRPPGKPPISIPPNGESKLDAGWPEAPDADAVDFPGFPVKLVVSAIGRNATNSVVFGRSSDELKPATP